jgi:centromere protein S
MDREASEEEGNLVNTQRLCASLHYAVGLISEALSASENGHEIPFDKSVVGSVANLAFSQLTQNGKDLEAFAKHAKRTTIQSDDVKLMVRRNTGLLEHISKLSSEQQIAAAAAKKRKATTTASATESGSTANKKARKSNSKAAALLID